MFYEPLKRGYEILLVASLRPFGWASLRPLLAVDLLGVAARREVARTVVLAEHSRILVDGRECCQWCLLMHCLLMNGLPNTVQHGCNGW